MTAPWEEDTAEEAAEQREANRQALRKAIRSKQQQRSSRQALTHAEQQRAEADAEAAEHGGVAQLPGIGAGLDPSLLSKIDARTLQALMKKAGIAAPNMPSGRKIRRAAQNLSGAQLAAMAASGAGAVGKLGGGK
jgi:hypothetical protein